eukprot:1224228-Rhodomonas_salina.1
MAHCSSPPGCQCPCWALAPRPGPPSSGPRCEGSHVIPATCWPVAPAAGALSRTSGPSPSSVVPDSVGFSSLPCCSPPAPSVHHHPPLPRRAYSHPARLVQGLGPSQPPYAHPSCFRTHSVPLPHTVGLSACACCPECPALSGCRAISSRPARSSTPQSWRGVGRSSLGPALFAGCERGGRWPGHTWPPWPSLCPPQRPRHYPSAAHTQSLPL